MEIKIFGRDISIIVHFQGEEEKLADKFIKFREIFLKSEFMTTSVSGNGYQWISEPDCRENSIYFRVMVKAQDEKRYYDFLKKFCEENGISFKDPRTQYQEEVHALYKRLDELKILIEESKTQEKE